VDLTYDGATTSGVLERQLPLMDRPPDLVTITMGGNDLMGAYGDTAAAEAVIRAAVERADVILGRIAAAFARTRRIVVSTVYDPSDGTGAVPGAGLPPWPDGPRLVRALNAGLAGVAARRGAVVADIHAHFLGHGAAAGDPGQPHPRPDDRELWYCGVIEPNAWGAHEIRRTWWRTIGEAGWLP
jgi:lysophospholipase L1-like esterase